MNPLPDRVVILGLLITLGLCFALVFWSVKLNPRPEPQLQWRDGGPSAQLSRWHPETSGTLL
jgi:energy-converting hydrogenase Eha subunit F